MGDDVSILPQWKRLLPAENVGNSKESLVGQVEKEIPQRRRRRRKGLRSEADPVGEEAMGEAAKDPETQSGKIVDITI